MILNDYCLEITDICKREHVSTDLIRYKENFDSAFSYIIVDSQTHTRTILYTPPKEDLFPEETIQRVILSVHCLLLLGSPTFANKRNSNGRQQSPINIRTLTARCRLIVPRYKFVFLPHL